MADLRDKIADHVLDAVEVGNLFGDPDMFRQEHREMAERVADTILALIRENIPRIDEEARETILEVAHTAYRKYQRGVRGQTVTEWDLIESWIIKATEEHINATMKLVGLSHE